MQTFPSWLRQLFGLDRKRKPIGKRTNYRPTFDALERRDLLASSLMASLANGVLHIEGTYRNDTITLRESAGNLSVAGISIVSGGQRVASVAGGQVRTIEIFGLGGKDVIQLKNLKRAVSIGGGAGLDTIKLAADADFVLSDGSLTVGTVTHTLRNIESAVLSGGAGANRIEASAFTRGRVSLNGNGGDDILLGGAGDDILSGGAGNDTIDGGGGMNTLSETIPATTGTLVTLANSLLTSTLGTDALASIQSANLITGPDEVICDFTGFSGSATVTSSDGRDPILAGEKARLHASDGTYVVDSSGGLWYQVSSGSFTRVGNGIADIALAPDRRLVALDSDISLRQFADGTRQRLDVSGMALNAEGSRLYALLASGDLLRWDTAKGECIRIDSGVDSFFLDSKNDRVYALYGTPDEPSADKVLRCWDPVALTFSVVRTDVQGVAMSADGSRLYALLTNRLMTLWGESSARQSLMRLDTATGEWTSIRDGVTSFVLDSKNERLYVLSNDGGRLSYSAKVNELSCWNAVDLSFSVMRSDVKRIALSADGTHLYSLLTGGDLVRYDPAAAAWSFVTDSVQSMDDDRWSGLVAMRQADGYVWSVLVEPRNATWIGDTSDGDGRYIINPLPDNHWIMESDAVRSVGLLKNSNGGLGSATLISPRHVLTAGHVVDNPNLTYTFSINGENYRINNGNIHIHPNYRKFSATDVDPRFDLAVIDLGVFVPESVARPSPRLAHTPIKNATVLLVGFGQTGTTNGSLDSGGTRRASFTKLDGDITDGTLSYRFDGGTDGATAHGDSGGPDFVYVNGVWLLAGVHSMGQNPANAPGTMHWSTRVDYHKDWIDSIVHPFRLQTGTALPETNGYWDFQRADWNGDHIADLFAIKKEDTASHRTEVYILDGASNYHVFLLHAATALLEVSSNFDFAVGDWNWDGRKDLFAIKKSATGTHSTEVHILDGAANFSRFLLQTGTTLHETGDDFGFAVADWNHDLRLDLVAIKKSNTGTHSTEIHILSGATRFQNKLVWTGTALHETGSNFEFGFVDWNRDGTADLVAVKKSSTSTGTTEVYVLSGATGFRSFIVHTGTVLHQTDDAFTFVFGAGGALAAIKKRGTGTGTTEVHEFELFWY